MKLTPAQLETLADRFLAAGGTDLVDDEFDASARSLRRRQRGSRIIGGGRPGARQSPRPLTANLPPSRPAAPEEDEQEDFEEATAGDEVEQAGDERRELLDDFHALLDTRRLAARDRRTVRMAQLAAARQREGLARMGDLLGFGDFHSLHRALYSLRPARRDRTPRGLRGSASRPLPGQLSLVLEG